MTYTQLALNNAGLPFDLNESDADAKTLLDNVPQRLWGRVHDAKTRSSEVKAYDCISVWITRNWREFLPSMSAKFPSTKTNE